MATANADTRRAAAARSPGRHFAVGAARAAGGALVFGLPILLTMEMWSLGFHMDRGRLALLVVAMLPLLVGLSHVAGFEETFELLQDVVDAFVALAIAFVVSALVLALVAVLGPGMSLDELTGKVALQAVPASIGALLAQSQLGGEDISSEGATPGGYWGELFVMVVGALFLAFNIAPTEEMVLLAYMMSPWHVVALAVVSLVVMHGFVYAVEFRGQHGIPEGSSALAAFLHFTVVGYVLALAISAWVLWTFGRLDGTGLQEAVTSVMVLGFPAAVGAAAARLLL